VICARTIAMERMQRTHAWWHHTTIEEVMQAGVFCCVKCRVVIKDMEGHLSNSTSRCQPDRIRDWEQRNRTEELRQLNY
jgi:hypothetical protein